MARRTRKKIEIGEKLFLDSTHYITVETCHYEYNDNTLRFIEWKIDKDDYHKIFDIFESNEKYILRLLDKRYGLFVKIA